MTTIDLPTPKRALAIGAHPDDIELGCGGTLAKWAAQGGDIVHLILTDGSKGTWNPAEDQPALVVRRQAEQRAAARHLGGKGDVVFLGWTDGELDPGLRQRAAVAEVIRRFAPDVVLGHDPWKRYRLHPDHRAAGLLTTEGIVAARDPLFFPELSGNAHRPRTLLLFEADEVDHIEDIAPSFEAKVAALLAHESQHETTLAIGREGDAAAFRDRLAEEARSVGEPVGLAAAEAFKRMDQL
jgi:LmbE family N-acetylglucosaminyl deacetylase